MVHTKLIEATIIFICWIELLVVLLLLSLNRVAGTTAHSYKLNCGKGRPYFIRWSNPCFSLPSHLSFPKKKQIASIGMLPHSLHSIIPSHQQPNLRNNREQRISVNRNPAEFKFLYKQYIPEIINEYNILELARPNVKYRCKAFYEQ